MKKKWIKILSTLFVCAMLAMSLSACKEEHTHNYTKTVTAPTCTEQGFTTYSCECGDSYTDNFIHALGHEFTNYVSDNNATCTENGTETASCKHTGCQESDTRIQENSTLGHDFTNYEYNNDADCEKDGTETAICNNNCGKSDTRTKTGTAFTHSYGDWISIGNGKHKKICSNDNSHTVIESCSGGTATCTEKAVCKDCNVAYGSVKHTYNQKIAENKYLQTSATCDSKAVYFYSCSCGDKGTTTFEYGLALGHSYGDWISIGNGQHKKVCANNSSHVITENCSGGTATCTEKAVCAHCKTVYGDFLEHSYDDTGYCVCGDKDENYYTQGITFMAVAGGYTVGWYNGSSTTLVIPDYYNGEKVVAISKTALNNCQSLKKIIIGNNVETIPEGVFRDCTSLQELTIPFVNDIFGKLFGEGSYYSYNTNSFIPDKVTGKNCSLGHLHQIPTSDAKWCDSSISQWVETSNGAALWQGEWVSPYTTGLWECKVNGITCYTYYAASSLKLPVYYIPKTLTKVTISNQQISTLSDAYNKYFKNVSFSVSVLKKYPVLSTEIVGSSEVYYGKFNYSDYKIKTTRTDGLVENTYLRKEYLSETDQVKLNTLGSHSITINYDGREINWNITIKPLEFSGLGFVDKTFTYDGQTKSLAVTGLPVGAKVNYSNNNKIDVGTYTVTATISLENYRTTTLTATLKIEQRELNVKFSGDTTIKYDGNIHKELMVSATNVVAGDSVNLSISYSGGMIEAGDYIATAVLATHKNYKLTTNNTCSIKITRETHTVTFKQVGQPDKIKTVLDLADLTDIPDVTPVTGYTVVWEEKDLTKVTKDITVKAIITINQYIISFVTKNGQIFDSITQDYNTEITLPKPTWTERSFVGWFDESLTAQFTSATMPAENITLYAKWINYEVFLNVDNLTGLSVNADLTDGLSYGVTAIDTDNNPVVVKAQLISGLQTSGTYITVRFVATGLHGVYATQMISDIKVYGMPAITYNTEKDYINDSDLLVASLFTATATDTFGESLFLNVSIKETGYKSGDTITIILSATDVVGNTTVVEIDSVKYYGTPTIFRNESVTEMKISDTISNEFFGVSATDSFGEVLTVNTVQYSGSFIGGNTIIIKSSVTDSKGNSAYITYNVKVYGLPTITSASKTNFKEGEEINLSTLGIIAKDSFGNALENVTLSLTDGTNAAGNMLTYLVTATDHLGNVNTKTFSVKIYGTPTITYDANKTAIKATDKISASLLSATAKDSFGNDLTVTATLESGEIKGGSCITIKLSTIDNVGNTHSIVTGEIRVYAQEDIVLTYNPALSNNIKKTSCGEEFNAIATDSFGEKCIISIKPASGYSVTGGTTINLYLVAMDKAGNTYTSEMITEKNVYDTPTLSYAREYDYILVNDNPYLLFTVKDNFGADRLFDVEIVSGSLQELGIIVYRITAEDKMGNKLDCEYSLKVIEYDVNGFLIYDDGGVATLIDYFSQEELVIPNGVQVIIDDLFKDDDIIKFVKLPDSVLSIGKEAFSGCVNLNEIILSNNITTINEKLFFNCVNLVNITIPDGVNRINSSAFSGCSSLESITLPFIGGSVENNVDSCETLFGYIFGTAIYTGGSAVKQYYSDKEFVTYYVPAVLKKVTITGGSLHYGAFYNCSSLTTIILPSNISIINTKAFYNCKALTSIEISNSVTNIGDYAFYYCNSLTSLEIPESVTSIGTGAFSQCRNLTKLIYNSINCIISSSGSGAFAYAGKDSTGIMVTIGKNVKNIPAYFFWTSDPYYQQPKIGTVEFEENSECVSIGRYSFYWCGIDHILIPTSVLEIEYGAFYNNLSFGGLTIEYSGTMTQWTQITLGYQWSGNKWNEGRYVYCTDGSIYYDKDGNKK